jgi:hypothetical protein
MNLGMVSLLLDPLTLALRRSAHNPRRTLCLDLVSDAVDPMTDDRTWTAEELERLSPDDRDRIVKEGTVADLSQVPSDFLARARAKGRALLKERGVIATDGS